jgi:flagellar biogenesis protein FliO
LNRAPTISFSLLAALALLLATPCLAQTLTPGQSVLAPSRISPPPPAIPGAYEDQPVREQGNLPPSTTAGGKLTAADSSSTPLDFHRVAISLVIVLALVFLCRWGARYLFPSASVGRSSQVMKVISRSVIAPKQQLLLIQVGRRLVLVGDCGMQMNALAEITDPDEVAGLLGQLRANSAADPTRQSKTSNPFGNLLGRAQSQFDDLPVPAVSDTDEDGDDFIAAGVEGTRGELEGLTDKIRMLSKQLGKT